MEVYLWTPQLNFSKHYSSHYLFIPTEQPTKQMNLLLLLFSSVKTTHLHASILVIFTLAVPLKTLSQEYHPPLDPPLNLSGSFGELRSNHFHSGLDIKTGGAIGKSVYAVTDGYVSRIRVGPYGFGRALYLRHPNGKTTVYAHLDAFDPSIEAFVRSEQYRLKQSSFDLFPDAGKFAFKKGDVIAKSGNSGSSGGPHLHFEVRETSSEKPLNPMLNGFPIDDSKPPLLESLMLIPISENALCNGLRETVVLPLVNQGNGKYRVSRKETMTLSGRWGFAVETTDQQDDGYNKNGTFGLRLFLNDSLAYEHKIEKYSFSETRYLNSVITFDQYKCCSNRATKVYVEPNNQLSFVQGNPSGYSFYTEALHAIRIEAFDVSGNTSSVEYEFKSVPVQSMDEGPKTPLSSVGLYYLQHNKAHHISNGSANAHIPVGVLYSDVPFETGVTKDDRFLTPLYRFGSSGIPAHSYFTLDIPVDVPKGISLNQLCFIEVDDKGHLDYWPGSLSAGRFVGKSRVFGQYAVGVDTVPPVIDPGNIYPRKNMRNYSTITFRVSDNFSGIKKIRATINGTWVPIDWDPKTRRLWYTIDETVQAGENTFELTLTDACGNSSEYVVFFTR